jgi:hypothetical protein
MSTVKSDNSDITINASGSGRDIKFQANGVEKASISSAGAFTSTTIDATKLTGTIPNFTSTGIDDNADATAITIDSSENVGIGVTPEAWHSNNNALQVGLGASFFGNVANPSRAYVGGNVYWNTSNAASYIGTDEASLYTQNGGTHTFQVAPSGTADSAISWTTAMTIENDGDIVHGTVGTGNAYWALQDNGSLDLSNNITTARDLISLRNGNGQVGSVRTSGSATSYLTSSDYRLKENVVDMENATDRVKQLKPKRFNFIADDTNTLVDGFIAHEVSSVVPEAISGAKDAMKDEEYEVTPAVMDGETVVTEAVMGTRSVPDYQGIDQSKLVPLLVASLQEAVAKIESLEARVTALEE